MRYLLITFVFISSIVLTSCFNGKDGEANLLDSPSNNQEQSDDSNTKSNNEKVKTTPIKEEPKEVQISIVSEKSKNKLETSSEYVNIVGILRNAGKVNKVEINNELIEDYKAGSKNFNYTVSEEVGNLKKGRNIYVVKAFDNKENTVAETSYEIISDIKYDRLTSTGFDSYIYALILAGGTYFIIKRKELI